MTDLETQFLDLADRAATKEDLFACAQLTEGNLSVQRSCPMFVAPFPLRITSVSLVKFGAGTISTSDSNWWLTRIRRTPVGTNTPVPLATKTTRTTAGTEPAGEAWAQAQSWEYSSANLSNAVVNAGEVVSFVFAPQGSPTAIGGPLIATVGYTPL